ncbi:hypothetical protein [Jeotgalibacillus soli]|uniref:hypothetical protein n=1 Tax=Jeotgalibacillus soli TaxID=889306 RepID=UPI00059780E9|nr:hypothetical protein [Jeotgalibacillus soli]
MGFSFLIQLQWLAPRGHKPQCPSWQRTPTSALRLMLVGDERATSAFLVIQLQAVAARGHKSS